MIQNGKIAFGLLGFSLVVLFVVSARVPLGPANSDYAALVNQAEDLIRGVAGNGVHFFVRDEARIALEGLTNRPLAPLLSAWSALSVGRLGLLDGSSSVRVPWILIAACVPVSVFALLRDRVPPSTAACAALWLLASPGFVDGALGVRPEALAVWSGWLVLVTHARAAGVRSRTEQRALALACASLASLAFGLGFGALWVVPVLVVHAWAVRGSSTLRAVRRGHVPVPTTVLLVLIAVPAAVVAFDPVLWHSEVPALIRRVFDEKDAAPSAAPRVSPFVLPGLLAGAGLVALATAALGRVFATGEFRPPRDRAAVGLMLALTLGLAVMSACVSAPSGAEFAIELLRPVFACLVGIGAAAVANRWLARRAEWAGAALVLLTLLVR